MADEPRDLDLGRPFRVEHLYSLAVFRQRISFIEGGVELERFDICPRLSIFVDNVEAGVADIGRLRKGCRLQCIVGASWKQKFDPVTPFSRPLIDITLSGLGERIGTGVFASSIVWVRADRQDTLVVPLPGPGLLSNAAVKPTQRPLDQGELPWPRTLFVCCCDDLRDFYVQEFAEFGCDGRVVLAHDVTTSAEVTSSSPRHRL